MIGAAYYIVRVTSRAGDSGTGSTAGSVRTSRGSPGVPRWVKVFAVIGAVVVVTFVVLHLTGNGFFGPGLHGPP